MNIPQHIYMIGIGGIGMSALSQLLAHEGRSVSGSDRDLSPTTVLLTEKGITVDIGQKAENIPDGVELIIYSDAIPFDHRERVVSRDRGIPEISYFEALGEVTRGKRTIAVAGTHGKTTTTGMLAKILIEAGAQPTAIVGSIVRDFGSNFVAGSSDIFVVEACEYRDHLLQLNPEILVITNLELDHTDYFPNLEALQKTFGIAVEKVPPTGYIITNPNDPHIAIVLKNAKAKIIDYTQYAVGELLLPGEFNRENARAALCAARSLLPTLSLESGVQSLATFHGSWRRFEYKGMTTIGALVYDDYAHHPTEVRKTIEAARQKFSDPASAQGSGGQGKKIIVAFHPHLYSRTRDFLDAFASALATADEVVLAPIYPAREEAIPGVTSEILAEKITALGTPARAFKTLTEVFEYLSSDSVLHATSILITMGAGDIYKVAEQLIKKV